MRCFSTIGVIFAIFLVNQVFGKGDKRAEENYPSAENFEDLDDVGRMLKQTPSLEVPQKSKLNLGYDAYRIDKPSDPTKSRFSYTYQLTKTGPKTSLRVNQETVHFQRSKKQLSA